MKANAWAALALSILILGDVPLAVSAADRYAVKMHGQTIGEVSIRSWEATESGQPRRITEIQNRNRFSRQGTPFDMNTVTRYVEDPADGKPLSFSHHADLGAQELMDVQGQVQGNALDLQLLANREISRGQAPITGERFLFAGGERIERIYGSHFADPAGSTFTFQTMNLAAAPEVVNTEVTVEGPEQDPAILALARADENTPAQLNRFAVRNPANQDSTVYEWRDAQGKLYRAQSPGNGMEMVFAQRMQVNPATLDLVSSSQVLTGVISLPRKTYEAVYRIAPLTGRTVDWRLFPESTWQAKEDVSVPTLQSATPDALYLKVKQQEPPDVAIPYPIKIDDPRYLQSTPYLQTTDELIERTAQDAAGSEKRAYFAARKLQKWVHENIEHKTLRLGFASAKETLLSREGDCTEHAVLLAALTRSLGIPSRVAVGLVYVPENSQTLGQFVYHMWTEVYIGDRDRGNWYPLDASFPEALPDATHIKLADSPLTQAQDIVDISQKIAMLMGHIKIDVIKALSPAGSVLSLGKQPGVGTVDIPRYDIAEIDIQSLSRKAIKRYRVDLPPKALSLDSPEGLFTRGVELLAAGRYSDAVETFRKSAAKTRRPAEQYRLGERLASIEMYELARENFERAVQGDRRFAPLVESWYGAFFPKVTLSYDDQALFARAVSKQLTSPDEEGDLEAADLLKQVYHRAPRYVPVLLHLGKLAERNGYYDDAYSNYAMAVSIDPDLCIGYERMGDVAMQDQQYQRAEREYGKSISCFQPHAFAQSKVWLDELQAKRKLAKGASLLAQQPRSATGWLETAKALYMQQRFEEANAAIRSALAAAPGSPEAQVYQFKLYYQQFEWPKMRDYSGKLAGAARQNAHGAFVQGLYEMRTRRYPQAVKTLKSAIARDPATPDTYITLAETYRRVGELENKSELYRGYAETTLRTGLGAMRDDWNRYRIQLELADHLFQSGKAEEAARLANSALDFNPVSAKAYRLKGQALLYLDDLEGARESLETALALDPNDSHAITFLGHTAAELGQQTVALDYYQRAHKADPLNIKASDALRNLIVQEHLAFKKPPYIWVLSNDERDYLIQFMAENDRVLDIQVDMLRDLNQLIGADFSDINTKNLVQHPQLIGTLSSAYDKLAAAYESQKQIKPPPRLAFLHDKTLHFMYSQVLNAKWRLQYFLAGWVTSDKSLSTLNMEYEKLSSYSDGAQNEFINANNLLVGKVTTDAWSQLVFEAKAEKQAEKLSEIVQLGEQLQSKGKKQKKDGAPKESDKKEAAKSPEG